VPGTERVVRPVVDVAQPAGVASGHAVQAARRRVKIAGELLVSRPAPEGLRGRRVGGADEHHDVEPRRGYPASAQQPAALARRTEHGAEHSGLLDTVGPMQPRRRLGQAVE
jgi:hypothetical protein